MRDENLAKFISGDARILSSRYRLNVEAGELSYRIILSGLAGRSRNHRYHITLVAPGRPSNRLSLFCGFDQFSYIYFLMSMYKYIPDIIK